MTAGLVLTSGILRRGSLTEAASFDRPLFLSYPPTLAAVGVEWRRNSPSSRPSTCLTLHGAFFSAVDATAKSGIGASAQLATNWISDTATAARLSAAVARTRRVCLTGGQTTFSHTKMVSFDLEGGISLLRNSNRAATGSVSVTVSAHSLGSTSYTGS